MTSQRTLFLLASFALFQSACEISDADLESGSLDTFTVSAASDEVAVMQVSVSGQASLSYSSIDNATVEFFVNGKSLFEESHNASEQLSFDFSATLALDPGPNDIVAQIRYNGDTLSQSFTVTAAPANPSIVLPVWTNSFTQSGTATITPGTGWNIENLSYQVDDGAFVPAEDLGNGDFDIALQNLDIGDSRLTLRVATSNGGFEQVHFFSDVVSGIAPVFDCMQSTSMLPTSRLIGNNNAEVRSMQGYFGDPDGGHTITFVIAFVDDNGESYVNPATVITKGRTSVDVSYNVDRFRCNNNPCNDTYDISLLVDGQPICSRTAFGVIEEF